jgi:hypothetical protein
MCRGNLRGGGPVVPHVAGAQQGLKGSGLGGGAGFPASCGTGSVLGSGMDGWQGSQLSDPVVRLRGRYPTVCGSGAGLWPGSAQGAESPAQWSRGSADLRDRNLAGQLFLY